MYKVITLLVLLSACTAPTKVEQFAPELQATAPAPTFDLAPWVRGPLPYRIALTQDIHERQYVVAAVNEINQAAGAEILVFVERTDPTAQILLMYGEIPEGGLAHAYGTTDTQVAQIRTTPEIAEYARKTARTRAVYKHELMHLLGYYAESGDVHDEEGSLMSESIELLHMELSDRHVSYLQDFAAFYE